MPSRWNQRLLPASPAGDLGTTETPAGLPSFFSSTSHAAPQARRDAWFHLEKAWLTTWTYNHMGPESSSYPSKPYPSITSSAKPTPRLTVSVPSSRILSYVAPTISKVDQSTGFSSLSMFLSSLEPLRFLTTGTRHTGSMLPVGSTGTSGM